jgi:hypothetical protein
LAVGLSNGELKLWDIDSIHQQLAEIGLAW